MATRIYPLNNSHRLIMLTLIPTILTCYVNSPIIIINDNSVEYNHTLKVHLPMHLMNASLNNNEKK